MTDFVFALHCYCVVVVTIYYCNVLDEPYPIPFPSKFVQQAGSTALLHKQ